MPFNKKGEGGTGISPWLIVLILAIVLGLLLFSGLGKKLLEVLGGALGP